MTEHGQKGVAKTPEHKAAISKALSGRTLSPEHKAKIGQSVKEAKAKKKALNQSRQDAKQFKSPHFQSI